VLSSEFLKLLRVSQAHVSVARWCSFLLGGTAVDGCLLDSIAALGVEVTFSFRESAEELKSIEILLSLNSVAASATAPPKNFCRHPK
jgi:hypothetical protein